MAKKKVSNAKAGPSIAAKEDFEGSNLSGQSVNYTPDSGRMSSTEAERMKSENPSYVVKSYATPIAWHGDKGWSVAKDKHSSTTSRHQSVVRNAIGHFMDGHDGARQ
jgi:hypothetical protein